MTIFKTLSLSAAVMAGMASGTVAMAGVRIQGAGATFPYPFYQRLVAEYQKLHPGVKIDYQGIGSGGGIKSITDKTVLFAGSDAPLKKSDIEKAGGAENLIEIPSCAGGVVPTYNLPGVDTDLKFTGRLLADIYLGKIATWNDPAIAKLNPGIKLPSISITPAWRTDGSGTTYVWTNYLCTQSEEFLQNMGNGKQISWPLGQGGKGNQGVTQVVQQTVGAIGYVEQGYADHNDLPYGIIQNKDGAFIKASPEAVSRAGGGAAAGMSGNLLTANIWNQPGAEAYPIASFTYLIVYKDLNNAENKEQAQAMVKFLWWATHDGQRYAAELDYAPLAEPVQKKVEEALKTITYKGQKLNIGE